MENYEIMLLYIYIYSDNERHAQLPDKRNMSVKQTANVDVCGSDVVTDQLVCIHGVGMVAFTGRCVSKDGDVVQDRHARAELTADSLR